MTCASGLCGFGHRRRWGSHLHDARGRLASYGQLLGPRVAPAQAAPAPCPPGRRPCPAVAGERLILCRRGWISARRGSPCESRRALVVDLVAWLSVDLGAGSGRAAPIGMHGCVCARRRWHHGWHVVNRACSRGITCLVLCAVPYTLYMSLSVRGGVLLECLAGESWRPLACCWSSLRVRAGGP